MDNVQAADVLDTCNYLLEEPASLLLLNSLYLYDVIEQFTPACILHYEVEFLLSLYNLIELHNLRVTNDLQYVNLSRNSLDIRNIADLALLQYFYRNLFLSESVRA